MSTTRSERNESFKKAFIIKAIPFLKAIFAKTQLGYNSIDGKNLCDKYEIQTNAVSTMVDLGILKMQGEKRSAMYHWKGGLINDDLAARIYDRIQMNKQHAKIKKKMEEQHDNKLSSKKLVKVIGSKRPVEFKNDHEAAAILRSMVEVHEGTKDKGMKTYGMLLNIIKKEANNDTLAERILKGLIDGNYITINKNLNTVDLYTWNEAEPNEEHALFIKDMIKETVGDDRPNRIFNFLMYLYKFKMFTSAHLRSEVVKFNLTYNDQSVITAEVLEFRGSKIDRQYKWKLNEAPSIQLAEVLDRKVKAYGAKYKKAYVPKKKESPKLDKHPVKVKEVHHIKEAKTYGAATTSVIEYMKNHDTITTDEACELIKQDKHSVANIFWRLCKDGVTKRVKMKTYAMVGKNVTVEKEKEKPVVHNLNEGQMNNDNGFIGSLKSALSTMRDKETKLLRELNDVREKIKEGEDLLALKEREHSYMASIGKFIGKKKIDHVTTAVLKSQDTGRKRHAHDKKTILDALNKKEQISLDEFIDMFYPGKGLNWNSDEVKSLSAMIYSLKKDGKIESPVKAIYKLKK